MRECMNESQLNEWTCESDGDDHVCQKGSEKSLNANEWGWCLVKVERRKNEQPNNLTNN